MQTSKNIIFKSILILSFSFTSISVWAQANFSQDLGERITTDSTETQITKAVLEQVLRVYPNPAKGPVTIHSAAPIQSVQLLNTNGRQLHTYAGFGLVEVRVNYADFRPGMYLVEIEHQNGQVIHRRLHLR